MNNKIFIMMADGFEEIEALATVDVLRRAGLDVTTMSIYDTTEVTGAHGVTVLADVAFDDEPLYDAAWVILPGGMPGASNLAACDGLTDCLVKRNNDGKFIAAICASPAVILAPLGILQGKNATCYPGMQATEGGANWVNSRVVVDSNIVTGNGPATALDFALQIALLQTDGKTAAEVAQGMLKQ